METFIYATHKRNARFGWNVTVTVYRVKRNKPVLVGTGEYNTGSTKGDISEAYAVIVKNGLLSKRQYKAASGYYHRASGDFQIFSV